MLVRARPGDPLTELELRLFPTIAHQDGGAVDSSRDSWLGNARVRICPRIPALASSGKRLRRFERCLVLYRLYIRGSSPPD